MIPPGAIHVRLDGAAGESLPDGGRMMLRCRAGGLYALPRFGKGDAL
jgi:hypothetical protein